MPGPMIIIDGREYPMPDLTELTMGQARVLKRYTGMSLEEIGNASPSDPDVIAGYCHLAISGAEPGKSFTTIEKEVEAIKFSELNFTGGDEENPPASTPNETASEPSTSGEGSEPASAKTPVTILPRTGTRD